MKADKKHKGNWRLVLIGIVLGFIITVGAFLALPLNFNQAKISTINIVKNINWSWTGFGETEVTTISIKEDSETTINKQIHPAKTLWNWLELLAVPILLTTFTFLYQRRDKEKESKQAELEREIAKDNLLEEAIQIYLDNMSKLLTDKEFRKELFPDKKSRLILDEKYKINLDFSNEKINNNPIISVARTQTITILRRLEEDKERQQRIIYFLQDAELYEFIFENANLSGLNLSGLILKSVNLQRANLKDTNFSNADLSTKFFSDGSNLQRADLSNANFCGADLSDANLKYANLSKANLSNVSFRCADISNANLLDSKLKNSKFDNAKLIKAKLENADISAANFCETLLINAKLSGANLSSTKLVYSDLDGSNFSKVDFKNTDLRGSNFNRVYLNGAKNLTFHQIKLTSNWKNAIYVGIWNPITSYMSKDPDNIKYIERLIKDKSSDPKKPSNYNW